MARDYIIINGTNSLTIPGLAIKTLPPISKTAQRIMREEIDGRDGDINTYLGYSAYDKTLEVGLFGNYDIDQIIKFFNTQGTITFSDEPDKFYNFQILDRIDYTKLVKFREAMINIHCQPFKYPLNETPLVEEYEYVEATGSNVTLDNTSEAIFNKIDLLGNTEQTQYTGKNKFYATDIVQNIVTSYTIYDNNNMQLVYTGTNSFRNIRFRISNITPNTNYKYRAKFTCTNSSISTLWCQITGEQTNVQLFNASYNSNNIVDFNSGENTSLLIRIYANGTQEAANTATWSDIEVVEANKIDTSYEPYVGGIPSPNPNYPQDIEVVTGGNEITICGRNMASNNFEDYTEYDTAYAVMPIKLKPNTTYTLKATLVGEQKANYYNYGIVKDGDRYTNFVGLTTIVQYVNGAASSFAFTTTSEWTNPKLVCYVGSSNQETKFNELMTNYKIYLEEGTTSTTSYEEYQAQKFHLNLGKNLFNGNEVTTTSTTNWGITFQNNILSIEHKTSYSTGAPNIDLGILPKGTYTISMEGTYIPVGLYRNNTYSTMLNTNGTTFDCNGTENIKIYFSNNEVNTRTYTKLQIEKKAKPSTYSPYFTPIEMSSIPNTTYKDLFVKENDTWYKREAVGKIILNGTEAGWFNEGGGAPFAYSLNVVRDNTKTTLVSNNFIGLYWNAQWGNYNYFVSCNSASSSSPAIKFKYPNASNLNDFKTWLGTHNTEVRYARLEVVDIEITNETLIDQLEAIKNAISYKGQTNISQTNNDAPFILNLSALKENSDHLVIDNIGNIYSKPTLDLEGTGIVDIYLNDTQMFEVDLSEKNEIVIDTEKMEAYNPTDNTLANRQVTGDYSKFKLDSGENDLRFSGDLTKATITNYERWL